MSYFSTVPPITFPLLSSPHHHHHHHHRSFRLRHLSETMSTILSTLQYWLVNHPKIQHFKWTQGETLGSSPEFLFSVVLTYLSLTFLLSHVPQPFLKPQLIKPFSILHNITLLVLSFIMALGCTLSIISHLPHVNYIICFPKHTVPTGALFFWAYIFYLSKVLEFLDTLLIILSNSIKRLTFLHVYHHATVVIMCYLSLYTSQSMFSLVLVTNSSVHVLMYAYYLSCALGVRPRWKKLVTDCQILQFWSSFLIMGVIFYYHFTGVGCSGIWGWCFNAVFIASLLVLFTDFHNKNYSSTRMKGKNQTVCSYHDNKLHCKTSNTSTGSKAFSPSWWGLMLTLPLIFNSLLKF